jgi:sugar lactone lactonase YvrE
MRPAFSLSLSFSLACLLCLMLSGCSLSSTSAPTPETGLAIQGRVLGGQQPIANAHVYLFAANTLGYGGAGLSATTGLSDSVGAYVLTNSTGNFSVTGDYSCTLNQQVYLYALGGSSSSTTNSAAGLLAVLGSCPGGNSAFAAGTPFVAVNEVSTVAAAYAFAGFATDATHVSSSGTALATTGIANAFANAANLASISTGAALAVTPAGNGTAPQSTVNTLANILAACINSTGPSFTTCSTLFSNAESAGSSGTPPTDTATAAINIAHNPGSNVANLYALSTATPPFSPALTAQPFDFTVALSFTGGGLNDPFSIAVDGSGNVWTANQGNNTVSQINGVTGAAISPAGGYTGNGLTIPFSIAIDPSGNAWVNNMYPSSPPSHVSVFTPAGAVFTGSPFSGGGLSTQNSFNATSPRDVAFDASGNAWFANLSGTATELNGLTGAAISPSTGYPISTTANSQSGVAVDSAGHVWISGMNGNVLYEMAVSNGAVLGASAYTAGGLEQPYSIAVDASNNIWLPDNYNPSTLVGNTVSKFTSVTTGVAYSGGGILGPDGVAIDGAGNVWVSNQIDTGGATTAGVAELNNSGAAISPATAYTSSATMGGPNDVAIDSSGNVWAANAFVPVTYANATNVVEFVGAAAPVVTPISVAVKNSKIGARP